MLYTHPWISSDETGHQQTYLQYVEVPYGTKVYLPSPLLPYATPLLTHSFSNLEPGTNQSFKIWEV